MSGSEITDFTFYDMVPWNHSTFALRLHWWGCATGKEKTFMCDCYVPDVCYLRGLKF